MTDSEINDRFWTNVELQLEKKGIELKDLAKDTGLNAENLRSKHAARSALRKDTECIIADYLEIDYYMLFVKPNDRSYIIRDDNLGLYTIALKQDLTDFQLARLEAYIHCLYEEKVGEFENWLAELKGNAK